MSELPFQGQWHLAAEKNFAKKYAETVVLIHHFGGSRLSTARHQDFLNQLGFDCVAFTLSHNAVPPWTNAWAGICRIFNPKMTYQQMWTENLNVLLNAIDGPKILMSFSSPSIAAFRSITDFDRTDIRAWVCDGGPFLNTFTSVRRFFLINPRLPIWATYIAALFGTMLMFGIGHQRRVRRAFKRFPSTIPVLSIRAGGDRLIPKAAIEKFFAQPESMNLQILEIPESDHIAGLRTQPSVYMPVVAKFLAQIDRA